jgi:hypothetical protein
MITGCYCDYRVSDTTKHRWTLALLTAILDCRFDRVPLEYLRHEFVRRSRHLRSYSLCVHVHNQSAAPCLPLITQACHHATIRAIKVIRLRMDGPNLIDPLTMTFPQIKFLHILRDPRGMIHSQKQVIPWNPKPKFVIRHVKKQCKTLKSDVRQRKQMESALPGVFMEVLYENMATFPMKTAALVYKFLDADQMPANVAYGLNLISSSHRPHDGAFGTTRPNSTFTAHNWKLTIPYGLVRVIDRHCTGVYETVGYRPILEERQLWNSSNNLQPPL